MTSRSKTMKTMSILILALMKSPIKTLDYTRTLSSSQSTKWSTSPRSTRPEDKFARLGGMRLRKLTWLWKTSLPHSKEQIPFPLASAIQQPQFSISMVVRGRKSLRKTRICSEWHQRTYKWSSSPNWMRINNKNDHQHLKEKLLSEKEQELRHEQRSKS